jgi:hypothetical protein
MKLFVRVESEHSSLASGAAAALMLAGRLNAGVVFAHEGVDLRVTSDLTVADVVRQYHDGAAAEGRTKAIQDWLADR